MKKKQPLVSLILFIVLMILLFLPLLQERFQLFKMKPLKGVYIPSELPELTLKNYSSGHWQKQIEPYISENFGFREFVIRLYNQYVFDFYNKTYSGEVAVGKDGWLYQIDAINQYYGLMNSRHNRTNKQSKEDLDLEVRSLVKIRSILKEYDVELMTFSLPLKSLLYPEHLRPHQYEDTLFHAAEYLAQLTADKGFPHLYMTPWFQQLRDEYPFTLYYEKGSHWASGAVLATDSVVRYMETLKGEHFPRIVIGDPYEVPEDQIDPKDYDLAELLNTFRLPRQHSPLYEFPVSVVIDSNSVYRNVLFSGTSYFWYMTTRVPFSKVFSNWDFFYYNDYYVTDEERRWTDVQQIDMLTELLTHDYVVSFRNEPQLYLNGYLFFGKALIALCISDERLNEKIEQLTDSLIEADGGRHPEQTHDVFRQQAQILLFKNPELFPELQGEAVPTARNPRIKNVLAQRPIRADRGWRFLMTTKAQNDSIDLTTLYELEANNVLNSKPLLCNRTFFTTFDYFDFLIDEAFKTIRRQPEASNDYLTLLQMACDDVEARVQRHEFDTDSLMIAACTMDALVKNFEKPEALALMQAKAEKRGCSVDKMFRDDVVWCFNNITDRNRYLKENTVSTAFERYKNDRKTRKDPPTMELVNKRRMENNLPLRVALDREIQWYINQKN